jgi:N-methylhydantoinase B
VLRDGKPIGPRFGKVSRMPLRRDDVVRLVTGSGGGYGDPREREPGLVAADVRDGLVTPDEAAKFYQEMEPN